MARTEETRSRRDEKGTRAKKTEERDVAERVRVARTYKMLVNGAFVRSESGRTFAWQEAAAEAADVPDAASSNIPLGSRKDVRDAVVAALAAHPGWAARTPYNRGQILYRLAEVTESRAPELERSLIRGGSTVTEAADEVARSIDRAVWLAGLADKISSLFASHNPVAGPHFGFSVPEAVGAIGIVAPDRPALEGLVAATLSAIVSGNTCVAVVSTVDPLTPLIFAECLATSDLPNGVINLLTGKVAELAPHLAKHRDVGGLLLAIDDDGLRASLERDAADSVKRVRSFTESGAREAFGAHDALGIVESFLETKSIWHPVGQ